MKQLRAAGEHRGNGPKVRAKTGRGCGDACSRGLRSVTLNTFCKGAVVSFVAARAAGWIDGFGRIDGL
jgi:hypothetical protein